MWGLSANGYTTVAVLMMRVPYRLPDFKKTPMYLQQLRQRTCGAACRQLRSGMSIVSSEVRSTLERICQDTTANAQGVGAMFVTFNINAALA